MNKTLFISLVFVFILSCSSRHNLISGDNIKSILITRNLNDNNPPDSFTITNQDSVRNVIRGLNKSDRKPIDFYPTYWLKINYSNNQETVIFSTGTCMNHEGLTYRLTEDIQHIIGR